MATTKFGDAEFYQQKKKYKKRMQKMLNDMQPMLNNSWAADVCRRFRDCIEPVEGDNEARLPIFAKRPQSPKRRKVFCVLHLISYTVQEYWLFCDEFTVNDEQSLNRYLKTLESYVENGLNTYNIAGKRFPGWYLEGK